MNSDRQDDHHAQEVPSAQTNPQFNPSPPVKPAQPVPPLEYVKNAEGYSVLPRSEHLYEFSDKYNKKHFILPVHVKAIVKDISSLSVLEEKLDVCLKVSIKVYELPEIFKRDFKPTLQVLLSCEKAAFQFMESRSKQSNGKSYLYLKYEIHKRNSWTPDLRLLPFDRQRLPVYIQLDDYVVRFESGESEFLFNICNDDNKNDKHGGPREYFLAKEAKAHKLGDFDFNYYQIQYEPIQKIIGGKKVQYYPQLNLYLGMTRNPGNYFVTILLPNFVLQLLSIIVFFEDNIFGARISAVTVLILAIVAFLPSVRAGLPNIPYITLMDLFIYTGIVNLGFSLLETSLVRHSPDYESKIWLIFACVLVGITTLLSGGFLLYWLGEVFFIRLKLRNKRKEMLNDDLDASKVLTPAEKLFAKKQRRLNSADFQLLIHS